MRVIVRMENVIMTITNVLVSLAGPTLNVMRVHQASIVI